MENIIKKAIEGGGFTLHSYHYKTHDKLVALKYLYGTVAIMEDEGGYNHRVHLETMFMSPLFWQALGKACGWSDNGVTSVWKYHAHEFYDRLLMTNFDIATEYLTNLIE